MATFLRILRTRLAHLRIQVLDSLFLRTLGMLADSMREWASKTEDRAFGRLAVPRVLLVVIIIDGTLELCMRRDVERFVRSN